MGHHRPEGGSYLFQQLGVELSDQLFSVTTEHTKDASDVLHAWRLEMGREGPAATTHSSTSTSTVTVTDTNTDTVTYHALDNHGQSRTDSPAQSDRSSSTCVNSHPSLPELNRHAKLFTLDDFTAMANLETLIARYGQVSHMGILDRSYRLWLNRGGDGALYFMARNRVAVVGGDPLCPPERYSAVLDEFREYRRRHMLGISFLGTSEQFAKYAQERSWATLHFGEERVLNPLTSPVLFETAGRRIIQQSRRLLNKLKVTIEVYNPAVSGTDMVLQDQLTDIYDTWRETRNRQREGRQQAFITVYDIFAMPSLMIYLYTRGPDGRPNGLAALRRLGGPGGFHIDPCIASPDAPRGVSDLLLFAAMALLHRARISYLSLGYEPRSELGDITGVSPWLQHITRRTYAATFRAIPVDGKKAYHDRFHPDLALQSRLYIVLPDGLPCLRPSAAVMHVANIRIRLLIRDLMGCVHGKRGLQDKEQKHPELVDSPGTNESHREEEMEESVKPREKRRPLKSISLPDILLPPVYALNGISIHPSVRQSHVHQRVSNRPQRFIWETKARHSPSTDRMRNLSRQTSAMRRGATHVSQLHAQVEELYLEQRPALRFSGLPRNTALSPVKSQRQLGISVDNPGALMQTQPVTEELAANVRQPPQGVNAGRAKDDGSLASHSAGFRPATPLSWTSSETAVIATCQRSSTRLRDSIELEHADPTPPNLESNSEEFSDWATLDMSGLVVDALKPELETRLLQHYLGECAALFDVHNNQGHYSRKDVTRMMRCPPWRAAALAISAKNLELCEKTLPTAEPISMHLYQLAVSFAIDSISGRFDCVGTVAGCVLLAMYDVMTVAPADWRTHLQGCASIFSHNLWNGSTGGLISASFWNYALIGRFVFARREGRALELTLPDIWAAYCAKRQTLLPPEMWFDDPRAIMSQNNVDEALHTQISTWLLARIVSFVHGMGCSTSTSSAPEAELLSIQNDMARWAEMGSSNTKSIISRDAEPDASEPFPQILFPNHGAAVGHIIFNTGKILLLEFEASREVGKSTVLAEEAYRHACITCGIIQTNGFG
ncbi:hypothetical protein B0J13DRAFT_529830 [Dactylonectria estremocensis]|uniref:Phosphatidylglycerol lysyltransferase C-terminal domain-containing protein n=1 Tax=Dactylonectria estremocensis TaxID=1079267 RepID=A0A9P9E2W7_9HYPO|nr:hypothetical protein B0J13DRAFT_529830 [Dactylonectria estremocensis]